MSNGEGWGCHLAMLGVKRVQVAVQATAGAIFRARTDSTLHCLSPLTHSKEMLGTYSNLAPFRVSMLGLVGPGKHTAEYFLLSLEEVIGAFLPSSSDEFPPYNNNNT